MIAEVAGTVMDAENVLPMVTILLAEVYNVLPGLFKTYIKKAKKQGIAV